MRLPTLFVLILCFISCSKEKSVGNSFDYSDLNHANQVLLESVMDDAFTPPVASRIYMYSHLANYITVQSVLNDSLPEITSKLNGLGTLELPKKEFVNAELAGLFAFSAIGKKLIYAEHYFTDLTSELKTIAQERGVDPEVIDASEAYAKTVSMQLASWIDKDMYIETRTYPRFTSTKEPQNWRETPPDYETGLEPHWDKIRTLVIDSANVYAFKPLPEYSTEKGSGFYQMVDQVYQESINSTEEKEKIAWFWDCNPIMTIHKGHMITTVHKFTPPGHWLNIVSQVAEKEQIDYYTATKAYTLTAMAMFEAIIAAWHVKYKTDLVRPITFIQENIDPEWKPVLQTPPFPEYTSGHSATSASAAEVLTFIFGDNYAFTDNTQLRFGLEQRSFSSFKEAAQQVNLSRFYGGIHYLQGVQEGGKQGAFVADLMLKKLNVL